MHFDPGSQDRYPRSFTPTSASSSALRASMLRLAVASFEGGIPREGAPLLYTAATTLDQILGRAQDFLDWVQKPSKPAPCKECGRS